jgi:hypothetical protein
MLMSKIENAQSAEKTTTTRCGIRETAITWNSEFRLHENTTGCRGRFPFYSHDAMWDKFQSAEGSVSVSLVSLVSDRDTSWCFLQPCLLLVWRRFLMTSEGAEWSKQSPELASWWRALQLYFTVS